MYEPLDLDKGNIRRILLELIGVWRLKKRNYIYISKKIMVY